MLKDTLFRKEGVKDAKKHSDGYNDLSRIAKIHIPALRASVVHCGIHFYNNGKA